MVTIFHRCLRFICCCLVLFLTACSVEPKQPDDYVIDSGSLPDISRQTSYPPKADRADSNWTEPRVLTLASLEQGNHHPAIAALFKRAEQSRQKQQWHRALKYLDQARQIQPRNAAVLYRQAWVNLKLGEAAQAEQLLRRAKVFAARDLLLMHRLDWLLAEALDAQGKITQAQAARQRATR